jgi:uncharacterized membrane protein YbhN (UPF0104 family)
METPSPTPAPAPAPETHRLVRVGLWLLVLVVVVVLLQAVGVDLRSWIASVWDAVTQVAVGYLVAGVVLQTLQTTLTALAWLTILRAAYPRAEVRFPVVLTAYAVGVALNGVLPANIGTLVMMLMFVALLPGATFPGILSGYLVHKLFFVVVGAAVYVYLFAAVSGSFSIQLGGIADHPVLALVIVVGALALVALLVRIFWRWLKKLWAQARQGGAVIGSPRRYLVGVFLPELGGYAAKLGVIAVFLAAYSIPVTFHTVVSVVGSNSLANVTSVTPGGVGVNQALNSASLRDVTDGATATAYSLSQQLITTAWNILFAVVLVALVLGWRGGTELVASSYAGAKEKTSELRAGRGTKAEKA